MAEKNKVVSVLRLIGELLRFRKGEDLQTDPFCPSGAELRKAGLWEDVFLKNGFIPCRRGNWLA